MIKPLGVHVLVEPLEEKSSVVLPELSKGAAVKGVVRGVGSQVEVEVKDGDTVYFRKYSPEEFTVGEMTVYLVEQQDMMGVEYGDHQAEG